MPTVSSEARALTLRYGCNPHQHPSLLTVPDPSPIEILNGRPGYINMLDALGAWQLVQEMKAVTGKPAAASFKHTSPAGAAIAQPLSDGFRQSQFIDDSELSPIATAYIRARGGDRMSSFGDAAAVSDPVDLSLAKVLKREVTDLIVAPAFEQEALELLRAKKAGAFVILAMDPDYEPPDVEKRELFGFGLTQKRNNLQVSEEHFRKVVTRNNAITDNVRETLMVATVALKYTQSNSVCVAYEGQVIGMGAGQQSRIHCTRLACDKADKWFNQQHPSSLSLRFKNGLRRQEKADCVDKYLLWNQLSDPEREALEEHLTRVPRPIPGSDGNAWIRGFDGICLSSDAYLPFRDNIDRAGRSNIGHIAQTGGSLRDDDVTRAADEYGMVMVHTGMRCFLH